MSKNNNVNPGQYKVAGRERLGENLDQRRDKQEFVKNRERSGPPKRVSKRNELMSGRTRSKPSESSS